jgi:hypothetical protein
MTRKLVPPFSLNRFLNVRRYPKYRQVIGIAITLESKNPEKASASDESPEALPSEPRGEK